MIKKACLAAVFLSPAYRFFFNRTAGGHRVGLCRPGYDVSDSPGSHCMTWITFLSRYTRVHVSLCSHYPAGSAPLSPCKHERVSALTLSFFACRQRSYFSLAKEKKIRSLQHEIPTGLEKVISGANFRLSLQVWPVEWRRPPSPEWVITGHNEDNNANGGVWKREKWVDKTGIEKHPMMSVWAVDWTELTPFMAHLELFLRQLITAMILSSIKLSIVWKLIAKK